jgi:hypothetical protein
MDIVLVNIKKQLEITINNYPNIYGHLRSAIYIKRFKKSVNIKLKTMIKNKIFRHHFYQYFKIIRKKLLKTIKVIKLRAS